VLDSGSLSELWTDLDNDQQFQAAVHDHVQDLSTTKASLEEVLEESQQKKQQLVDQQKTLVAQKKALDVTRQQKDALLSETKEQESAYQKLLAEKRAEKESFKDALQALESQLAYTVDPNRIPPAGKGILRWPLASVFITQKFGNTEFAKTAAYNGQGHNGVDFRASIGTPVFSSLSGTVMEVNHGVAPNCQYGKWVLVRHNNGLTTLYAHLSDISVSRGDVVDTGQLVGFSGNTGYATGPHLHMSVYISDAVQLKQYKCRSGITVTIPVAAYTGYLNPLDYL